MYTRAIHFCLFISIYVCVTKTNVSLFLNLLFGKMGSRNILYSSVKHGIAQVTNFKSYFAIGMITCKYRNKRIK